MHIDKTKLKIGLWFTDEEGNVLPWDGQAMRPDGAVYAHSCYPLEVTERIYKIREDGGYDTQDNVFGLTTNLSRENGKLIVAMVNSGDYDLYEALGVCAHCCERCLNVLWNKYLPEENEGYAELSEEWTQCNTVCDFCRDMV